MMLCVILILGLLLCGATEPQLFPCRKSFVCLQGDWGHAVTCLYRSIIGEPAGEIER